MNLLSRVSQITRQLTGRTATKNPDASSVIVRAGQSLGAWQGALGTFTPREVNPHLYEALREALPILDGAINRLVTLDGIVRVTGTNKELVATINDGLMASIPVNDAEAGLQAAYASQGGELYEQGLGLVEMVMDKRGRELIGLRVPDAKGIAFDRDPETLQLRWWYRAPARSGSLRRDGTDQVEAVLRRGVSAVTSAVLTGHDYTQLDPSRMVYAVNQPEADNPYGVSVMRSMEFVAQILLKIQNATGHVWDRFGDPSYKLTYKTKNRRLADDAAALATRRDRLARDLAATINAKRAGNSADFVQAIGADDDILLEVIGGKDQVMEIEMPARHMLEQIVGKTGVPAWLLGLQWTTAERLAQQQSEMVLQESRTRFERRLPGLRRIVETWLRGRGLTWKPGDWQLVQELPSLHDELKRAQAAFLNAQTEFMRRGGSSGGNMPPTPPGTDQGAAKSYTMHPDGSITIHGTVHTDGSVTIHGARALARHPRTKASGTGEPWAEDDAELPRIEARATGELLSAWGALQAATLAALSLPAKQAKVVGKAVAWSFAPELRTTLAQMADTFELQQGADQGALMRGMLDGWLRGVENAAGDLDVDAALRAVSEDARILMRERALGLIRSTVARTYRDDILAELADGAYNGLSPPEVAKQLRARFGAHDYDWERLARSEIAQAQVMGKEAEYAELGVTEYDYITAEDERVSAICRRHEATSPHTLGAGPLPMRDSHPNCRCSIRAVVGDL